VIRFDRVVAYYSMVVQRRVNQFVECPWMGVARSAVTSVGGTPTVRALGKKPLAAATSRREDRNTSMTWPC
jgi:hypothetical protein